MATSPKRSSKRSAKRSSKRSAKRSSKRSSKRSAKRSVNKKVVYRRPSKASAARKQKTKTKGPNKASGKKQKKTKRSSRKKSSGKRRRSRSTKRSLSPKVGGSHTIDHSGFVDSEMYQEGGASWYNPTAKHPIDEYIDNNGFLEYYNIDNEKQSIIGTDKDLPKAKSVNGKKQGQRSSREIYNFRQKKIWKTQSGNIEQYINNIEKEAASHQIIISYCRKSDGHVSKKYLIDAIPANNKPQKFPLNLKIDQIYAKEILYNYTSDALTGDEPYSFFISCKIVEIWYINVGTQKIKDVVVKLIKLPPDGDPAGDEVEQQQQAPAEQSVASVVQPTGQSVEPVRPANGSKEEAGSGAGLAGLA
jgi:hypothetical protein